MFYENVKIFFFKNLANNGTWKKGFGFVSWQTQHSYNFKPQFRTSIILMSKSTLYYKNTIYCLGNSCAYDGDISKRNRKLKLELKEKRNLKVGEND